ncbi:MAG: RNA polymerase sigma factor [Saccharofermentanaceae bacterium]|jgi:RNA polymerase sigma-70 factor (ECF subfamily)|nr:RNA polymerase sigma factor [Bacteroidales bacterium]
MSEKDDNELVYEVIKGSISSFEVLIDRYQKTIFNMALKMVGDVETAKDITQDVFVKTFEKMGSFDFNHRFFSWIYRIALNQTLNYLKTKPPIGRLKGTETTIIDDNSAPDYERNRKILHAGLQSLPADYRVLLLLKYFCGLSYEEIAETTKIPMKKVRSRLYIAREQLSKIMIGKGFFEND